MPKASSVPSVLDPRCPSRLVLDRIADKWTALVIQILAGGTMRYAALQREIGGISQKMLTQTLRSLERDGLVQRTVHPVVPPKVEYSLTKLGRTLIEPLQGLCRWSEKHLGELQANRARAKAVAAGVDRGKWSVGILERESESLHCSAATISQADSCTRPRLLCFC